jgi:hypothetical protein
MSRQTTKEHKLMSKDEAMVKTSLRLPAALWKATKIRAIELNMEAQQIVALALEQFLRKGGGQHER